MKKKAATKKAVSKKKAVRKAAVTGKTTAAKRAAPKSAGAKQTARMAGPRKSTSSKPAAPSGKSPSQLIDARIQELGDWRGTTLSRLRTLIKEVAPDVTEEWKWRGVPVWYQGGMICTGETYKAVVKITFAKGAALQDPARLFNSSLDGNVRRAIDFHEGEAINEEALKTLIRAAIELNQSSQ
jgi:hypothetical protein